MNGDSDHGALREALEWAWNVLATAAVPLMAWVGWMFRRYRLDRKMLTTLDRERTEFRSRFGAGLVEHTQDVEDVLDEHERELDRCRKIHAGMTDGETGLKLVAQLQARIDATDRRFAEYRLEDVAFKTRIDEKLEWIKERLDGRD